MATHIAGADASDLSNVKYGYDYVVSTTQASINSGLLEYLSTNTQPAEYICVLADPQTGNPAGIISLDDFKKKAGVDPFSIPINAPYNDPRITACTRALFICGIKIQMGLPLGVMPKNLPAPIVTLGDSANNVRFNMYCSQFSVIENSPPSGFGGQGVWNVWSQSSGKPWYVTTTVNLVNQDLSKELDTPYFNNHPAEKNALLAQLNNLSGTAFSLQQLLFDLDNAVLQSTPKFGGIPEGSNAEAILTKSFINIYSNSAKANGLPLIAVQAVSQSTPDPSQLHLTALERMVSPVVDENSGARIQNPTPLQQSATTLNYLCAVDGNKLPGASTFNWNWVEPADIDMESGVISINRNTIANYFMRQVIPDCTKNCYTCVATCSINAIGSASFKGTLSSGASPQIHKIVASGPTGTNNIGTVAHIEYTNLSTSSDQSGASSCAFNLSPTYTCDIAFSGGGNTLTVTQRLALNVFLRWDLTEDSANIFDTTITDIYTISVNQNGGLQMTGPASSTKDNSGSGTLDGFSNFFVNLNGVIDDMKSQIKQFFSSRLTPIPFNTLQSFIFPGAKVFTYKSVSFSSQQDLISKITYVKTNFTPTPTAAVVKTKAISHAVAPSTKAAATTTSPIPNPVLTLAHTSDLMQNYVQGQVVSPQSKFEALQTDDGHALLFSTDTQGVLNVIEEQTGKTATGWTLTPLSTAIINKKFPGSKVRTFDVGQSVLDGTIGLAMAISFGGTDNLVVSLGNSNKDTSWINNPAWVIYPFDIPSESRTNIIIDGILFSETIDAVQFLVVDIDRSTNSLVKDITRYHIDPTRGSGTYWVRHDVSIDIESGNYQSCVGRAPNSYVDAIYTSGKAGGAAQLVYEPIINAFGDGPATPVRFGLPGGLAATAIAAARNIDQMSDTYGCTDLYAVGASTLYYFATKNQNTDGTLGAPLITNSLFLGTDELFAMTHDGVTTIWGKNASDVVYYLSCPITGLDNPASWSIPVPILNGIERISTYVNRSDGGNTIFASGGGKLQKLIQGTDDAKLWQAQQIQLSAPPQQKSLSFNSYTTTLQLTNGNNLPAKNVNLTISTKSRTPVYINGLYYFLGQTPITVTTDSLGSVTVIEATENLNGAILDVTVGTSSITINPMDKSFQKLAALNSEAALSNATVTTGTKAGGIVGPKQSTKLVSPTASPADKISAANNVGSLGTIYNGVGSVKQVKLTGNNVIPATPQFHATSFPTAVDIAIAAGDLFQWLKSGVNAAIKILQDGATKLWHFIATIAGKVYQAVLDTAGAIIGAVEWVFNAIKTGINDLVNYVSFLFEWDDIARTKNVVHNVIKFHLQDMVNGIHNVQEHFDSQIAGVEKTINQWAGIKDWSPLGATAGRPASSSASNPVQGQNSGSQLLSNHFQNQAHQLTIPGGEPSLSIVQDLVNNLLTAISNEGKVLSAVYGQLQTLATDFPTLSVTDIIKRVAGILADGLLSSVQVVVDALLQALYTLANAAVGLLDQKIHIPIISDILNEIGIPDISFLDLFTWIAAVAYTVPYKIANNSAPFPDDNNTAALIAAKDWPAIMALFHGPTVIPTPKAAAAHTTVHTTMTQPKVASEAEVHSSPLAIKAVVGPPVTPPITLPTIPATVKSQLFTAGHGIAAITGLVGDVITVLEAEGPTKPNPYGIPSAVLGVVTSVASAAADTIDPHMPIKNEIISGFSNATTATVILSKLIFSGPAQEKFGMPENADKYSGLAVEDGRATGAIVNSILIIPSLAVSGWHFFELSQQPDGKEKDIAIVQESGAMCSYIGRVAYAVAVNDPDPISRVAPIAIMGVAYGVVAGLETAAAVMEGVMK